MIIIVIIIIIIKIIIIIIITIIKITIITATTTIICNTIIIIIIQCNTIIIIIIIILIITIIIIISGKLKTKSACPIEGDFIGVIPDDRSLCSKITSDCNRPDFLHHTVFPCGNESLALEGMALILISRCFLWYVYVCDMYVYGVCVCVFVCVVYVRV